MNTTEGPKQGSLAVKKHVRCKLKEVKHWLIGLVFFNEDIQIFILKITPNASLQQRKYVVQQELKMRTATYTHSSSGTTNRMLGEVCAAVLSVACTLFKADKMKFKNCKFWLKAWEGGCFLSASSNAVYVMTVSLIYVYFLSGHAVLILSIQSCLSWVTPCAVALLNNFYHFWRSDSEVSEERRRRQSL